MIVFGNRLGIKWNKHKAIDFWAMCLCAYETEEGPEDTTRWLHTKETAAETARKELDGVALELIRQFAVFEALHHGGYSPAQHVRALREVMPGVSRSRKAGLRDLVEQLAM